MSSQFIKLMLSCGQVEEGILENWAELDKTDNSLWVVISMKDNPQKKLKINKKYIAAHQIEEVKEPVITNIGKINEEQFEQRIIKKEADVSNKKLPFKTSILRAKSIAEQRIEENRISKEQIAAEYAEAVYASPISILKKT